MNVQKTLLGTAAIAGITLCPATAMAASMVYSADLDTLNGDFGSTAKGAATVTVDEPGENLRSIRVQIQATGLEDVSSFGGVHVAHIHGQFAGNASRPLFDQGNGPFFEGTGGTPVSSVVPTLENDDADGDGYLNFIEGRPAYGPVVLNLTSKQLSKVTTASGNTVGPVPSGTPPLSQFLGLVGAGEISPADLFPTGSEFNLDTTYDFDLTDPDQARQFNNLSPLNLREVVLHGLTLPASISDPIDAAVTEAGSGAPLGIPLSETERFRITAPVAAGTLKLVSDDGTADVPEPISMSLISASLLVGALGLTRRRTA
ncbi:hypothetical protein IQ241_17085 [Romeria aff. gracilis LEGE 07310]|uniref:CHRD domain-containing protein n=1 Tax=Vasconcelosia minhoensis LEGE 07310 TaxID=915328 RepID=A0A8J7AHD7_9CYAN|nr:hypothetical protein [Romeria gracilis]MBE9078989.1 hypothetical protein [Romeria aff. gracilis LEGE 07310]